MLSEDEITPSGTYSSIAVSDSSSGTIEATWRAFQRLGFTEDLLPVPQPHIPPSPQSAVKQPGKVPGRINGRGEATGLKGWTQHIATPAKIAGWSSDERLGVCVQTRRVRAIDIDIDDPMKADEIEQCITETLGTALPCRTRPNSGKRTLLIVAEGEIGKHIVPVDGGAVEFLGNGQQTVLAGMHTSGVPYQWRDGLPDMIPAIPLDRYRELIELLVMLHGTGEATNLNPRHRGETVNDLPQPEADWLCENWDVLGDAPGGLYVRCPFENMHTSDSGLTQAMWMYAGTNGHAEGHFRCLHAHCSNIGRTAFLNMAGYPQSQPEDFPELASEGEDDAGGTPHRPLRALQEFFGLMKLGGQVRVLDLAQVETLRGGGSAAGLELYRMADGRLLMKRRLVGMGIPGGDEAQQAIERFLTDPATLMFNAIAFSPRDESATTLNLWSGSPVMPAPGDWTMVREFLLDIICNNDPERYAYLTGWIAHALRRPEEKPGVAIVLIGGQGTGKGTLFELLRRVWPRTTLTVANADHVTGGFNAALEHNFIACLDEAYFVGDRKTADRLKALITERHITVEEKNQPRRTIESYHRFIMATNHNHAVQAEADDRRYAVFRVSGERQGDHAYWARLHEALTDPAVIAAVVDNLMAMPIDDFNVRERPKTPELMEQKLDGLRGFDAYWYEVLATGKLRGDMGEWEEPQFVTTEALLGGWGWHEQSARVHVPRSSKAVSIAMARLCPPAAKGRPRHRGGGRGQHGYHMPSLADARAEFERAMCGKVEWDE